MAAVLLGGTLLGLATSAWVLAARIDPAAHSNGPWVIWSKVGTPAIDPYARAILAQTGAVPLAAAEGIVFTASADETGAPLSARCTYRVVTDGLPARVWTLAAATASGAPLENPAGRGGFASVDLLRREGGGITILVGPSARPGNWLPLSGTEAVILTLRLYGTPLSAAPADIVKTPLPTVTPLGCAR